MSERKWKQNVKIKCAVSQCQATSSPKKNQFPNVTNNNCLTNRCCRAFEQRFIHLVRKVSMCSSYLTSTLSEVAAKEAVFSSIEEYSRSRRGRRGVEKCIYQQSSSFLTIYLIYIPIVKESVRSGEDLL